MLKNSIFKKFSPFLYQVILISTVILMYICVCAEADIYVPAFPQMIEYFKIAENEIQSVLSVNFLGLSISGLIAGPLSDSFGRRKTILIGLTLFMLSSTVLLFISSFKILLFWRFIQGVAAAVLMVCSGAMIADKFTGEKGSKLIGIINSIITAAMAGAPILGAYLSQLYSWKANFITVMILSIIAFVVFLLFIEESLEVPLRSKFRLKTVIRNYITILSSIRFICYGLIACLPFITILIYISNLSVVFINHLGISIDNYSYYQATTMAVFVLFSLSSVKIISYRGIEYTKNMGIVITIIGVLSLLLVSIIDHTAAIYISISSAILAAGSSMLAGTFGIECLSIFPEMNGTALAAVTAIRLLLIAIFLSITEVYFDGTILPTAIIIASYTLFVMFFYIFIILRKRNLE